MFTHPSRLVAGLLLILGGGVVAVSALAIGLARLLVEGGMVIRPADAVLLGDLVALLPFIITFAMANLVAGRQVVPELMQDDFTPDAVASHAISLLQDPSRAAAMRADLREVKSRLGVPGASGRAAEAILTVARRNDARGLR